MLEALTASNGRALPIDAVMFTVADRWHSDPFTVWNVWPAEVFDRAVAIMAAEGEYEAEIELRSHGAQQELGRAGNPLEVNDDGGEDSPRDPVQRD